MTRVGSQPWWSWVGPALPRGMQAPRGGVEARRRNSTAARRSHVHEGLPASRGVGVVHQTADYQSNVVGQETLAIPAHIRYASSIPSSAVPSATEPPLTPHQLRPTPTLLMASQEPLAQTTGVITRVKRVKHVKRSKRAKPRPLPWYNTTPTTSSPNAQRLVERV